MYMEVNSKTIIFLSSSIYVSSLYIIMFYIVDRPTSSSLVVGK